MNLRSRARKLGATNPRDKVFTALGLGCEMQGVHVASPGHHPNYTKMKDQVYEDFTRASFVSNGRSEPLEDINTFFFRQPRDVVVLCRTWLPDFEKSTPTVRIVGYQRSFSEVAGNTLARIEPSLYYKQGAIALTGFEINTIQAVASGAFHRDAHFNLHIGQSAKAIQDVWRTLVMENMCYPFGDNLLDAYVRTLTCVRLVMPMDGVATGLRERRGVKTNSYNP